MMSHDQVVLTGTFALLASAITASAVLGSQAIGSYFALKNKRTELWFTRKVESYQRVLRLAAAFAIDPLKIESYLPFIAEVDTATIVASPKVSDLLINP